LPAELSSKTIIARPPTFERTADATLDRTRATYAERGNGYGDSWDVSNVTDAVTRATLERFGIRGLDAYEMRLLQLACLIDVKDSRLIGKWNPDSLVDGIAYRAVYTTLRDEYEQRQAAAVILPDPSTV